MSSTYVPVEASAIDALDAALAALERAHDSLSRATAELADLGEDLCTDATRRLRERGASEAQVEGYEEAWRARRKGLAEQLTSVRAAKDELERAAALVRGE